jgi:hypothetical protein
MLSSSRYPLGTDLAEATRANNLKWTIYAIENGANINTEGKQALYNAIYNNNKEIVLYLLGAGVKLTSEALHMAVLDHHKSMVLLFLYDFDLFPDKQAYQLAMGQRHYEIAKLINMYAKYRGIDYEI